MRRFRIRLLTAVFAVMALAFSALPASADPGDGGVMTRGYDVGTYTTDPGDGGVITTADPGDGGIPH